MRRIILLLGLMAAASPLAMSQNPNRPLPSVAPPSAPSTTRAIEPPRLPFTSSLCRGADLSVRHVTEDVAMGGQNTIDYAFKNKSSMTCTLKGYPRYELLDKSGTIRPRGRAIHSQQLPGDEAKMPPRLVTIGPGEEAWFRVYYNSGGAGHVGKPCPTTRKIRIVAPGTTRPMVVRGEITLCGELQVSSVRGGPRQQ